MFQTIKYGWRTIRQMPGLAAVVVLSLGIGIGVNTAIFSWIEALVLQPLPAVTDSASFHLVEPRNKTGSYPGVSWPEYQDLRDALRLFRDLVAFRMAPLNVGEAPRLERTYGQLVSGNYFEALRLAPVAGRFIRPDEVTRPGGEPVVVISYNFWRSRFGGAPDAVGRELRVNGRGLTIIGVAPDGFQGTVVGLDFDLWVPATLVPALLAGSTDLQNRAVRGYAVIGKLLPNTTVEQAQTDLNAAMTRLAHDYPETNASVVGEVLPFWQSPRGPQRMLVGALTVLQGVMLLVLVAVCGNTANLMLARASTRQREIAVRMALGAGRWTIIRLLMVENLLLALFGAVLGAAIAVWGSEALRVTPMTFGFPIRFLTRLDLTGLVFAVALGLLSGLMFGLVPALQLSRGAEHSSLRAGTCVTTRSRVRDGLMSVQVALALIVLVIAAMFFKSFREGRDTDPGFTREGVLLAAYDFTGRDVDAAYTREFAARLLDRLRALPSVEAAAISSSVPLDIHGMPSRSFTLEGRAPTGEVPDQALIDVVTPDYFAAMRIPVAAGSGFADLRSTSAAPEVVVNEEFVRRFVQDGAAIGRSVDTGGRRYTIVAVVRNSVYEAFGESPTPIMYFSYRDRPSRQGEIHLRTRPGNETRLTADLRRVMQELDPALPLYNVRTLTEHIETNLLFRRIPARMFVVLAPLLLVLAATGIYAVVAYAISHRTMEIGVRLALGATGVRVAGQLVRDTLRVIGYGALAGWLIALVIDREVGTAAFDVRVFVAVPAILLVIATLACWLPALRATRVDPNVALRHE